MEYNIVLVVYRPYTSQKMKLLLRSYVLHTVWCMVTVLNALLEVDQYWTKEEVTQRMIHSLSLGSFIRENSIMDQQQPQEYLHVKSNLCILRSVSAALFHWKIYEVFYRYSQSQSLIFWFFTDLCFVLFMLLISFLFSKVMKSSKIYAEQKKKEESCGQVAPNFIVVISIDT